jgi:hypothetical protein
MESVGVQGEMPADLFRIILNRPAALKNFFENLATPFL